MTMMMYLYLMTVLVLAVVQLRCTDRQNQEHHGGNKVSVAIVCMCFSRANDIINQHKALVDIN